MIGWCWLGPSHTYFLKAKPCWHRLSQFTSVCGKCPWLHDHGYSEVKTSPKNNLEQLVYRQPSLEISPGTSWVEILLKWHDMISTGLVEARSCRLEETSEISRWPFFIRLRDVKSIMNLKEVAFSPGPHWGGLLRSRCRRPWSSRISPVLASEPPKGSEVSVVLGDF